MRIHAFSALRASANRASEVGCPPYDVVDFDNALAVATLKPNSFMRVIRSEVDFPAGTDPHSEPVYLKARENLESLIRGKYLVQEPSAGMFVYRQAKAGRRQCGLVCCVDVEEYRSGVIRKHELTRPDKESDRTHHMLNVAAHCEAVLLAVHGQQEFVRQLSRDMNDRPLFHFAAKDGVTHTLWSVHSTSPYMEMFRSIAHAYIADGHHRCAAADRAARLLEGTGDCESQRFPAVIYPSEELLILPYHRLVKFAAGQTAEGLRASLGAIGSLIPLSIDEDPHPRARGEVSIYLQGTWWRWTLPPASSAGPLENLDVVRLTKSVLGPILGIGDERTDQRISFMGGCGCAELRATVDAGKADVAFAMFATSIDELFAVAQANLIMPPKSTWFDPKIRSGLFAHPFGECARGLP